jgi:hypothetical protein
VRGAGSFSSGTQYTGLVRVDGSTPLTLVQDSMSSPVYATRTGSELQSVVVSPSDGAIGSLTPGSGGRKGR